MYKKLIWYTMTICFLVGFGLFIRGFYHAFQIGVEKVQSPNGLQENVNKEYKDIGADMVREKDQEFFVLGDSLGRGTGDAEGKGFAGNVVDILRESTGIDIVLHNAAIEGLKTEGLLEQLSDGNIIRGIKNAEIIFISIGGNDLREIQRVEAVQREQSYIEISEKYKDNLRKIITGVRQVNPKGIIVFLGLYNLDYRIETLAEAALLMQWNYNTGEIIEADEKSIYIPTYDLFKLNYEKFMSSDGLHPNDLGYKAIGKRMADVILPLFN